MGHSGGRGGRGAALVLTAMLDEDGRYEGPLMAFVRGGLQQRVDEALGPTPQVAELERLGISPREIAEVSLPLLLTLPLPLTRT